MPETHNELRQYPTRFQPYIEKLQRAIKHEHISQADLTGAVAEILHVSLENQLFKLHQTKVPLQVDKPNERIAPVSFQMTRHCDQNGHYITSGLFTIPKVGSITYLYEPQTNQKSIERAYFMPADDKDPKACEVLMNQYLANLAYVAVRHSMGSPLYK